MVSPGYWINSYICMPVRVRFGVRFRVRVGVRVRVRDHTFSAGVVLSDLRQHIQKVRKSLFVVPVFEVLFPLDHLLGGGWAK